MKSPVSRLFILALFTAMLTLGMTDILSAQNQKIAYIDSEFILSKIPEYDGVDQRLRQLTQTWNEEIEEKKKEIEALELDFQVKEILYTPEVRREKEQEISNKKRDLDRYIQSRFGPDGDYFRQQRDLLEPIQRKVVEAVSKVAQRDGFDFVFDRNGDYVFFYTRPQWDISVEVLLEMGIQVDESERRGRQ
jgi:outer membrane protein